MDLSDTIHGLGELLGAVITEQESPALFETEERIRGYAKAARLAGRTRGGDLSAASELQREVARLDYNAARTVAAAFTLYFDLVNLAEELYRVQALRQREAERHPQPVGESIADALSQLK